MARSKFIIAEFPPNGEDLATDSTEQGQILKKLSDDIEVDYGRNSKITAVYAGSAEKDNTIMLIVEDKNGYEKIAGLVFGDTFTVERILPNIEEFPKKLQNLVLNDPKIRAQMEKKMEMDLEGAKQTLDITLLGDRKGENMTRDINNLVNSYVNMDAEKRAQNEIKFKEVAIGWIKEDPSKSRKDPEEVYTKFKEYVEKYEKSKRILEKPYITMRLAEKTQMRKDLDSPFSSNRKV